VTDATTLDTASRDSHHGGPADEGLALVVVWCASEPWRVGERLVLPDLASPACVFGRGAVRHDDPEERLTLARLRPGAREPAGPFENPFVSRRQLELRATAEGVRARNLGRRGMLVAGRAADAALVAPGETVEVERQVMFVCVRGPRAFDTGWCRAAAPGEFGAPDAHGIVGEGAATWALRDRVAFVAGRGAHVLLHGASGSGKELVARCLHALSGRGGRRMVSRNAATLPAGLIDAELFGNVAHYPHAGMPERAGLVGEADGSTLFLDEIGELPLELQTHLLRVLDAGGDYQRLGESRRRSADLRVIAATNRPLAELKGDLAARFTLRLEVPGLDARREDIPLVARHLLRRAAAADATIRGRFFDERGEPRLAPELVRALVRRPYTTHVRELDALLWAALTGSTRDQVELTPEVEHAAGASPEAPVEAASVARREPTREEVAACLERHAGVQERAWRELGLANRYVLKRLVQKYGLRAKGE